MKILVFKSIKTRLMTWILIITLIPLLFVLYIAYQQRVSAIQEQTFDKLTVIRDLKVSLLKNWIMEREGDIRNLSHDSELEELEDVFNLSASKKRSYEIAEGATSLLNHYLNSYKDYSEIFILNAQTGIVELSTSQKNKGKDKSKNLYFTQTLQNRDLYIKDIHFHDDNGSNIQMTFSMPIFSSQENESRIIGILVTRLDLHNSLYKILLDKTGLGETGETLIVNQDVMALNELRFWEDAPLNLKVNAEPAIKAAQGGTGIVTTMDYRKVEVLAAYTYIEETGWGFVSKQDLNELYAPIKKMILNFILLFMMTAIAVVALAFRISSSITNPLINLNIVTKKIADGDLSIRNTVNTDDELGSLATEFNRMADVTQSKIKTQKGVSEISEVMIGENSKGGFSLEILKRLMTITDATMSVFYALDETTAKFEHIASIGGNKKMLNSFEVKSSEGEIHNAISKKSICYLRDIPETTIFKYKTTAGAINPKEIITIPIMENSTVVAIISLVNIRMFTVESYAILEQAWYSINAAFSSIRASDKTNNLAKNLVEINQELETQSEEMKVQALKLHRSTEELKEQNNELEMQKSQLDSASRLKTVFLSNMSHELRTPLNSVIALSGVLSRKLVNQIPEEEYSYLSVIKRNGKHLLSLINDILDISRIESGREEIIINEFNVNGLVSELVDMLHPQVEHKNIELNQIDRNIELLITSDAHKCRHILQNLIGNAVKFTEKGKVEILVEKVKNTISIIVKDTGIGISKKMIPHVFDEFHQVDGSTSRRFEGTGLGLTIAKKYANLIGGLISVKSTLGKGSEFTLTLPITYEGANLGTDEQTAIKMPVIKQTLPNLILDFSAKTILLVDDNESVIIQVKSILEEMGYKTLIARNGNEALEIINHAIPDGIVLDLMMPEVSGFEVLKKIRDVDSTAHVPVLILTAKLVTKPELKFLKRNNVHQLIQKGDIKRNELLNAIAGMVFTEKEKIAKSKRVLQDIKGKPVILVVEDNPDNMITVKAMLDDKYKVIEAVDGKQGVKMAKKHVPNLILMDIALPIMDGYQAFKSIRTIDDLKHIPIVALTASAMEQDREKILEHGFDSYIAKPIEEKVFYNTINRVLYVK